MRSEQYLVSWSCVSVRRALETVTCFSRWIHLLSTLANFASQREIRLCTQGSEGREKESLFLKDRTIDLAVDDTCPPVAKAGKGPRQMIDKSKKAVCDVGMTKLLKESLHGKKTLYHRSLIQTVSKSAWIGNTLSSKTAKAKLLKLMQVAFSSLAG